MKETGEGSMCPQTFSSSRRCLEELVCFLYWQLSAWNLRHSVPYKQNQQSTLPPSLFFLNKDESPHL